MRDIKLIRWNTVPCWYELSWRKQNGIVLRIHKDFADKSEPIPHDSPIVSRFLREFGFSKFGCEFGKDFGFENSLKFLRQRNRFLEYFIPTPLVRKYVGACSNCHGSGKSRYLDGDKCLYCDGVGRNLVFDYAEAYAVSASVTVLFTLLRYPDYDTSAPVPQLMCVNTVAIRGSHGGAVGGEYSREALTWMRKHGPGEIPEMVAAMKTVWKKMDGEMKSFYKHSFRATLSDNDGWLCTDCPGQACGLHPSHDAGYFAEKGQGFEFSSHNVDTPTQQLVILASLATLHDLMRKGTMNS